jgi:hypothetical protein
MKTHRFCLGTLGLVLLTAAAGCAGPGTRKHVVFASADADIPTGELKQGWDDKLVHIPVPEAIPAETIRAAVGAWQEAGWPLYWPVQLPNGRRAMLCGGRQATAKAGTERLLVFSITFYRPDGTPELFNIPARVSEDGGLVNQPQDWTVFEADGKTTAWFVECRPNVTPRQICSLLRYKDGKQYRRYWVKGQTIWEEEELDEQGHPLKTLHFVTTQERW